jgi:hypothetical protein
MSKNENKNRKLKSYLSRKAFELGLQRRKSEESFGEEKRKWSLKRFIHQKLFDIGLLRLPPEDALTDEGKWERGTDRLRRKLSKLGLEGESLEKIFEDENRKWTLKTKLRVGLFTLRLTWRRLKQVFDDKKKRWSPQAYLRELGLAAPRPIHAAAGLAVLSVAMLAIWSGGKSVAENSSIEKSVEDAKFEIKDELFELEDLKFEKDVDALVVMGEVNSRKERINVLRQSPHIDDSQTSRLDVLELRMQSMLVISFLNEGIESELERKDLESMAQVLKENANPELSGFADFTLCAVAIKTLSADPTEENATVASNLLSQHQDCYVEEPRRAASLVQMLFQTRKKHSSNDFVGECIADTGAIFERSSDVAIKNAARNVLEYNSLAKFNLEGLEKRIRFHGKHAAEDINGAIEQLRLQPDVMLFRWSHLIRCCEAFGSISDQDQLTQSRKSLCEIAETIADSNPIKQEVLQLLERQKKRISAVGTKFDTAGDEEADERVLVEASSKKYTLVAFVDQMPSSRSVIRRLASTKVGNEISTIIAFEPRKLPANPKEMSLRSRNIRVASEETSKKYFGQMPIDFFPQCILVDAQGTVLATNLLPMQVAGWVAAHEKAMDNE